MDLLVELKKNPFVLAPMAGITDVAFRSFMKELGCGIVVTELISANGLEYSSARTKDLMRFEEVQRPIGIQLFGEHPELIARAAKYAQEMGADFVDLNFGCPVPKVVKKGAGAALLKDLPQMKELLRTVKSAITIPLTIKIRTGWDEASRNAAEVVQLAADEGITWVAIHGRTRSQGYSGWADWDYIGEVKSKAKIPVLGNGDIQTAFEAVERVRRYGVDGVLIGRGALKNPWIFKEALRIYKGHEVQTSVCGFPEMFQRLHFHIKNHYDEHRTTLHLKKFSCWFSTGYPGSSQFRKNIFQTKSIPESVNLIQDFFLSVEKYKQVDTRNESFLMGGHG